jgi:hypothetical protein
MLTDSKFWFGVVAGIILYLVYTNFLAKKMKG